MRIFTKCAWMTMTKLSANCGLIAPQIQDWLHTLQEMSKGCNLLFQRSDDLVSWKGRPYNLYCVKNVPIWSFSGPYFPVFPVFCKSPYSVQIWENTNQKKLFGHCSRRIKLNEMFTYFAIMIKCCAQYVSMLCPYFHHWRCKITFI